MPNTITAYNTFNANTKAKSSEVNTNFSNHRGHLIPIDPNTAAAGASNTYDNGTAEHSWRSGYFGTSVNLLGLTSTGNSYIENSGLTAGGLNVVINGNTSASFKEFPGLTSTAEIGNVAYSAHTGLSYFATSAAVTITALTLSTIGRPVIIQCHPLTGGGAASRFNVPGYFEIRCLRDGNTVGSLLLSGAAGVSRAPSDISFMDNPGNTTSTYTIEMIGSSGNTISSNDIAFTLREI